MKKNWLYIISPCKIAAAFLVVCIIDAWLKMDGSEGWVLLGIIIALPLFLLMIIVDAAVKVMTKDRVPQIWLVEILIITITAIGVNYYLF